MTRSLVVPTIVLLACVSGPVLADLPAVMACAKETDDKVRLACYDAAVVKLKAELAAAEARKLSLFGFALPFSGAGGPGQSESAPSEPVLGPREVNEIDAKLDHATKDGVGHVILELDNGEAWKVLDERLLPLSRGKDTTIQIVRNQFGGYYLNLNGETDNITVNRVR
jgi:hypothetical protein